MKNFLLSYVLLLTLTACSVEQNQQTPVISDSLPTQKYTYSNRAFGYQVSIPPQIFVPGKSQTGTQIFFGNINAFEGNDPTALNVFIFTPANCSKMGVSTPSIFNNNNDLKRQGRVDFYDQFKGGENPDPAREP